MLSTNEGLRGEETKCPVRAVEEFPLGNDKL